MSGFLMALALGAACNFPAISASLLGLLSWNAAQWGERPLNGRKFTYFIIFYYFGSKEMRINIFL